MHQNKYEPKKRLFKSFIIKGILCYILWQILYLSILRPHTNIEEKMVDWGVKGTIIGLNSLGFDSHAEGNIVYINEVAAVRVEKECSGLELIALYIGFLLCFPGSRNPKIAYILIGSVILFFVNIVRDIILALNSNYFSSSFEINHKYTYTFLVYIIVFLIWKHWVKHHSLVAKK